MNPATSTDQIANNSTARTPISIQYAAVVRRPRGPFVITDSDNAITDEVLKNSYGPI